MPLNYIGRYVLGSLCVGDSVWLGWSCRLKPNRVSGTSEESETYYNKTTLLQQ